MQEDTYHGWPRHGRSVKRNEHAQRFYSNPDDPLERVGIFTYDQTEPLAELADYAARGWELLSKAESDARHGAADNERRRAKRRKQRQKVLLTLDYDRGTASWWVGNQAEMIELLRRGRYKFTGLRTKRWVKERDPAAVLAGAAAVAQQYAVRIEVTSVRNGQKTISVLDADTVAATPEHKYTDEQLAEAAERARLVAEAEPQIRAFMADGAWHSYDEVNARFDIGLGDPREDAPLNVLSDGELYENRVIMADGRVLTQDEYEQLPADADNRIDRDDYRLRAPVGAAA